MPKLVVTRLDPTAIIPVKESVGYLLFSPENTVIRARTHTVVYTHLSVCIINLTYFKTPFVRFQFQRGIPAKLKHGGTWVWVLKVFLL